MRIRICLEALSLPGYQVTRLPNYCGCSRIYQVTRLLGYQVTVHVDQSSYQVTKLLGYQATVNQSSLSGYQVTRLPSY